MRHQLSGRQLSRNSAHRWAMFRNMATSLLKHETIRTTIPKAKELRRIVEPLITLGKKKSEANKRRAMARLRDEDVVTKLFDVLGKRFADRPGGYTRILRMDPRPGDAAPMALMQLLDQPEPDAAASAPAEGAESDKAEDKKTKKAAAKKKVRTQEEKAARKVAKAEQKASAKAKKAAKKADGAKSQRKVAAPKKKAAAKKKSK